MAHISFVCPYCRYSPMNSPEQLCLHVEEAHQEKDLMSEMDFKSGKELERWLNRVEESRSEGGVLGPDEGKDGGNSEFYIMCSPRVTPNIKRRRLAPDESESRDTLVSCTAFVHIQEKADGTFHIKFCLDHTADCEANEEPTREQLKPRNGTTMKRRSRDELQQTPCSSAAGSSRVSPTAIRRRQDTFDLTSMNRFLSHRIDHAASSLRNLNQVISDLATDIHNRIWNRPPPIIPVHYPNEIYIS